jgi:hypothetical protein
MDLDTLRAAFETDDVEIFLACAFPPHWSGIEARILESGVTMSKENNGWAPQWSPVSLTVRGTPEDEPNMIIRSVIYRVHDMLHNLWGMPHPYSLHEKHFSFYKKVQMAGEIAVLTLTEFEYCNWLREQLNPEHRWTIDVREAVGIRRKTFSHLDLVAIGNRVDELLHKKMRFRWITPEIERWIEYYIPMLENDRKMIDRIWEVLNATGWKPNPDAPSCVISSDLTGREITEWMIKDFQHKLLTSYKVDKGLRLLNMERRARMPAFPPGWAS